MIHQIPSALISDLWSYAQQNNWLMDVPCLILAEGPGLVSPSAYLRIIRSATSHHQHHPAPVGYCSLLSFCSQHQHHRVPGRYCSLLSFCSQYRHHWVSGRYCSLLSFCSTISIIEHQADTALSFPSAQLGLWGGFLFFCINKCNL